MSFDLAASLRRIKPQRSSSPVRWRADEALDFAPATAATGPELLLDTCVYIDILRGRTPTSVDRLLSLRILNHSTIALAELTNLFGRLDPAHPRTEQNLARIRETIDMIPTHRLESPSRRAFAEAGMLAGLASRLTGETGAPARVMDALLLLQARDAGRVLLTRNIRDFDLLQQLEPNSRVLFYR